jgi:putative modified peptide
MQTSSELSSVLNKLASDDLFRAHLMRDPAGALADLGIALQPDQVPSIRSLPSKESIEADKIILQSILETTAVMTPFLLSGNA